MLLITWDLLDLHMIRFQIIAQPSIHIKKKLATARQRLKYLNYWIMAGMDKLQIFESRNISKKVGHSHFHFFKKKPPLFCYYIFLCIFLEFYTTYKSIFHKKTSSITCLLQPFSKCVKDFLPLHCFYNFMNE